MYIAILTNKTYTANAKMFTVTALLCSKYSVANKLPIIDFNLRMTKNGKNQSDEI